jgi:hypothetical protein
MSIREPSALAISHGTVESVRSVIGSVPMVKQDHLRRLVKGVAGKRFAAKQEIPCFLAIAD